MSEREPDKRLPESEMMHLGWDPADGMMSLKPPLFQTSTFVFESAAAAERLFQIVYGGESPEAGEGVGFIYTRMDHPNLVMVEERLASWDDADGALVFSSGTAAIFTAILGLVSPGQLILHSTPLYGGTNTLFQRVLAPLGYLIESFGPDATTQDLDRLVAGRSLGVIYLETPANPTNDTFDIQMAADVVSTATIGDRAPLVIVDNTFLGPYAQKPLRFGADLVVYSATKFFGGHSDLVAGAVTGRVDLITALKTFRYRVGTTCDPHTAWLLGRSLETYALRAERQTSNAILVAAHLLNHPKVATVRHLGQGSQWTTGGSMISFDVVGGKQEAFRFLDAMTLIGHTTSLGGTESIACHPWTTTHSNMEPVLRKQVGVTESMIRLSIGVEAPEDIIADLDRALAEI